MEGQDVEMLVLRTGEGQDVEMLVLRTGEGQDVEMLVLRTGVVQPQARPHAAPRSEQRQGETLPFSPAHTLILAQGY